MTVGRLRLLALLVCCMVGCESLPVGPVTEEPGEVEEADVPEPDSGPTQTPVPTPDLGRLLTDGLEAALDGNAQAARDALEAAHALGATQQAQEVWTESVATLYTAGEYEQAGELAEAGLAHYPEDASLLYLGGLAALTVGDTLRAVERLDALLEVAPDDGRAWRLRGVAHVQAGDVEQAVPDFERAVELGEVAGVAGNGAAFEAMADLANALAVDDPQAGLLYLAEKRGFYVNNVGVLPGALMTGQARIYAATQQTDAALELLGRAIQRNYTDAYYYRAEVWAQIGELEKAISDLETYLNIKPSGLVSAWAEALLAELRP